MLTTLERYGNGFKVEERDLGNSEVELTVEILEDGIQLHQKSMKEFQNKKRKE